MHREQIESAQSCVARTIEKTTLREMVAAGTKPTLAALREILKGTTGCTDARLRDLLNWLTFAPPYTMIPASSPNWCDPRLPVYFSKDPEDKKARPIADMTPDYIPMEYVHTYGASDCADRRPNLRPSPSGGMRPN